MDDRELQVAEPPVQRLKRTIVTVLLFVLVAELVTLVLSGMWMHVFLVICILALMAAPRLAEERFAIAIPVEVQIFTILFIFATLFLGEIRDFYNRLWWWDLALHTSAGILLGLLGFLVLYLLNENEIVSRRMRPSFLAVFAFFFSVALGAIWEIFEFAMDRLFGLTMQKPMFDDPSGLTDTMWDLIVDTLGAALAGIFGWLYLRRDRAQGSDDWLHRFVLRYPSLFDR